MLRHNAFSLVELSIILVISGLMLGFVLQSKQSATSTECLVATRNKVQDIGGAIKRFARKNDRLPMPAARNIGVEDVNYGREALAANITQSAGVSFGAVPFQALGLPVDYASDCWGNKLTYMVTTALTSSSNYDDTSTVGTITLKNTTALTTNTITAYAILSHGEDQLGAVKNNYSGAGNGWCTGASTLTTMNCRATDAEVASGAFNNGKDAGTNYFDDIILAAGKPEMLVDPPISNLYCWGDNNQYKLGDGTTTDRYIPTVVSGEITFTHLSAGEKHTCALATTGAAYCWGENNSGQLGDGTTTDRMTPTPVTGGLTFASIATGSDHTCGLTTAGAAYCWGYNSGRLGNNMLAAQSSPTAVDTTLVTAPKTFSTISAGGDHTCAITTAGVPYCWGENPNGQVGDNSTTTRRRPVAVNTSGVAAPVTFASISAGGLHSCGITTAGVPYCWGYNIGGRLGDGTSTQRRRPTAVDTSGVTAPTAFASIVAASGHSCGLTTAGAAYCWGINAYGQVGDGTTTSRSAPRAVTGGQIFNRINNGRGGNHTCGRTQADKVYCWGRNDKGQLGNGTTTDSSSPVLVSGSGTYPLLFDSISSSLGHSCALADADYSTRLMGGGPVLGFVKGNGEVWIRSFGGSWAKQSTGTDFYTQLAGGRGALKLDNSTYYLSGWDLRTGPLVAFPYKFTKVMFSYDSFFGITSAGKLFKRITYVGGWNVNPWAALGAANTYKEVSAGYGEVFCAINTLGDAECAADNTYGAVGKGTFSAGGAWNTVVGGGKWLKIAKSFSSACGIQTDQSLWCWGRNHVGQLGDGTNNNAASPVKVGNLKWKSIAAHANHWGTAWREYFCGVTTTGDGYCWGQLSSNWNTPQKILGSNKWLHIAPNTGDSCGITTNKSIYCFTDFTPTLQTF